MEETFELCEAVRVIAESRIVFTASNMEISKVINSFDHGLDYKYGSEIALNPFFFHFYLRTDADAFRRSYEPNAFHAREQVRNDDTR
jgi:hypothetical protein